MPVDLTINIPTVLTLLGFIWVFVQRATRIEERVETLRKDLDEHTEREEKRFESIGQEFWQVYRDAAEVGRKVAALEGKR